MKMIAFHKEKCAGCSCCAIACMDRNDFDPAVGGGPFRRAGETEHKGAFTQFSVACTHCGACIGACPKGCLTRDAVSGFVLCDNEGCIGCQACLNTCPSGEPKFDNKGKMHKCDGCLDRVRAGLPPACVRACPTGALTF